MPRRDGTGPMGQGPMTGRGRGLCIAGTGSVGAGLGFGLGSGYGCLRRGGTLRAEPFDAQTRKELLAEQKKLLETRLEYVNNQLECL